MALVWTWCIPAPCLALLRDHIQCLWQFFLTTVFQVRPLRNDNVWRSTWPKFLVTKRYIQHRAHWLNWLSNTHTSIVVPEESPKDMTLILMIFSQLLARSLWTVLEQISSGKGTIVSNPRDCLGCLRQVLNDSFVLVQIILFISWYKYLYTKCLLCLVSPRNYIIILNCHEVLCYQLSRPRAFDNAHKNIMIFCIL